MTPGSSPRVPGIVVAITCVVDAAVIQLDPRFVSAVFSSPLGLSGYDGVTKLDDARLALALALAPGVEASEDNKV